jgi:hypothetical protein
MPRPVFVLYRRNLFAELIYQIVFANVRYSGYNIFTFFLENTTYFFEKVGQWRNPPYASNEPKLGYLKTVYLLFQLQCYFFPAYCPPDPCTKKVYFFKWLKQTLLGLWRKITFRIQHFKSVRKVCD